VSYTTLLINTCTVQRFTESLPPDAYGNPVLTWDLTYLENVPCRLTTSSGREIKVGAELVIADYKLFLNDVDITEQDKIVISGITYEVLLVADKQDGIGSHHKECFMRATR